MGLFNWVDVPITHCSKCETELIGWQTKEDQGSLIRVPFYTVNSFYTWCNGCGRKYEYTLKPQTTRTLLDYHLEVDDYGDDKGYALSDGDRGTT